MPLLLQERGRARDTGGAVFGRSEPEAELAGGFTLTENDFSSE